HRRQRKLRVARAEKLAAAAGQDFLIVVAGLPGRHRMSHPRSCTRLFSARFRGGEAEFKAPDPSRFVAATVSGETLIQQSAYMMRAVTASANCLGRGQGPGFPHVARPSGAAILAHWALQSY